MSYLYALRHKTTGRYLPRQASGQKGGTWVEPRLPDEQMPRFFHRERDAKTFLTVWCWGPQSHSSYQDISGDWVDEVDIKPDKAKEPRIKSEYEVVTIHWGVVE